MVILKTHPCEQCGTVKYRKTPEGQMVCKYGHLLAGWRQEEGDEQAWMGRARKTASANIATEDRGLLQGIEREAITIQIIQYGLQIVSRAFVHDLGFDPSFEYIVRELWLLFVQKSGVTIPEKYTQHHVDVPVDGEQSTSVSQPTSDLIWESLEAQFDLEEFPENDRDIDNEYEEDELDDDSSDDDTEDTPMNRKTWPRPMYYDIMVFCYLACLWMRAPVMASDIHRWCLSYKLPYFKVATMIPKDLVERLEKVSLRTFTIIPTMEKIYNRIFRYKCVMEHQAKLVFPEINAPVIISRFCAQFYLPSDMYYWAQFIHESIPVTKFKDDARINVHGEVRILASIFILIKMLYVLDDGQTDPAYKNERIPGLLPRATWREHIKKNLNRWEYCRKHEMVGSQTTDISLLLELSNDFSVYTEKKNHFIRRNVLRNRMKAARVKEGIPPRPNTDLFMEPPDLQTAMSTDDDMTDPMNTHDVGSVYLRAPNYGLYYNRLMCYDEHRTVALLAAEILNINPRFAFISMMHFEDVLLKKMKREETGKPHERRVQRRVKRRRVYKY